MSIINPKGFDNVIQWADFMSGQLGFLTDPNTGTDDNFERLDDESKWQTWACGIFGGVDELGQDSPDTFAYDDFLQPRTLRDRAMPNTRTQTQAQIGRQLQPKGGLAQLMAEKGASKSMVADVQRIEDTPGGKELLYTQAAQEMMKAQGVPKQDVQKVRLYRYGGAVERAYAKGGDVKAAAAKARGAGRGEDEMLVHMTGEEFGVIKKMWGEPDTNPNTGLPEYGWLSKIWKKVKKVVKKVVSSKIFQVIAPIALSIFVPGLGAFIGGALAPGVGAAAQGVIGNALVRGGLSAAGGGDFMTGAISGAVSGGLGKIAGKYVGDIAGDALSERTAEIVGSSLASGAGASLTGGEFMEGAVMGGLGEMMRPTMEGITSKGQEMLGLQDPEAGGILAQRTTDLDAIASGEAMYDPITGAYVQPGDVTPEMMAANQAALPGGPVGGGDKQQVTPTPEAAAAQAAVAKPGLGQYAMPALLAASALGGGEYEEPGQPPLPEGWDDPLPDYQMNRQFTGMDPSAYYTYGQAGSPQSGQHLFMEPQPFAGVPNQPGGEGGMEAMIAAGQPVPANMVGMAGPGALTQAGYTQDASGNWNPPQLGAGLPQARGGYQRGGTFDYWSQNADVPRVAPTVAQQGRYVKGAGTGRSDDIPARLSDGEYVMDAETVALLGDGSGSAGAKRLDEMRRNLRQHKAEKLKKGGFSHKAKAPHQYMARGGMAKLRRAMTEAGRI